MVDSRLEVVLAPEVEVIPAPRRPAAPRLGCGARLLVRAAWVVGGVLAVLLGLPVDPADLLERGGASEDALRRRRSLVRRVREDGVRPKDIGTTFDLFKGEYAFGTYAVTGYALTNNALDAPETRVESVEVLDPGSASVSQRGERAIRHPKAASPALCSQTVRL